MSVWIWVAIATAVVIVIAAIIVVIVLFATPNNSSSTSVVASSISCPTAVAGKCGNIVMNAVLEEVPTFASEGFGVTTPEECLCNCLTDPNCLSYMWALSSGYCGLVSSEWVITSASASAYNAAGFVVYQNDNPCITNQCTNMDNNTNRPTTDTFSKGVNFAAPAQCQCACVDDPDCITYIWNTSQDCYISHEYPYDIPVQDNGTISGLVLKTNV